MGKKKSIAIYARDVVFENNEESFIKMCYMMNNKITDAICNEIENLNCTVQYIDKDMAISDVQSSIYIALRTNKDFKNDNIKRKFYYMIRRELRNMAHDAVSNQLCMDGISEVADYGDTIGFNPLSIDEIEERRFISDLVMRFQDAVLGNDNKYKIGLSTLRPREMQALAYNLGFMECGELSYTQIGHKFNRSRETVRQIAHKGLRKLRGAVSYLAKYKWYFVGTYIDEPSYRKNDQPRRNDRDQKITQDITVSPHLYFKSRSETVIDISPVDAWDDNCSIFRVPDKCKTIYEFTGDNKLPSIDDYDGIDIINDVDEFGNATRYVLFDTSKFFAYHVTFNSVRYNSLHRDPRRSKRAVFIRSIKDDAMSLVFYTDKTGQFLMTYVPPYHIRFEVQKIEDMYSVRTVAYQLSGTYIKSHHPNDFFDRYNDPNPYRSIVKMYGKILFISDEVIIKNPPDYSGKDEHWMRPMYDLMVDKVIDYQQHTWISN